MLLESLGAARDLGRLQDVVSILIRYGFGDLMQRLGLSGALARAGKLLPLGGLEALTNLPPHERVRRAMEEMGPSFIKLGQVLATRVDIFTPEWIEAFGKLQTGAPALPYETIRARIAAELGAEPESLFAEFDPEPLAAASIAQVHGARLHDGRAVVVKVRRPGIRAIIEADMRLLQRLAHVIESESEELARYQPVAVVKQFRASLTRELDLAEECRNADRIRAALPADSGIVIPQVYWDYTSERINVQERIEGIRLSDIEALGASGIDRPAIARRGAQAVLRMMFVDGFFHADPHPGNVFCLPGDRIGLIDFGMVGRLSSRRRAQILTLLHGLVQRDAEQVAETLLEWTPDPDVHEDSLIADVEAFVDQYHGLTLKQLDLGAMLLDITQILREHRLKLPPDLALMIKVFLTLEGMGRNLDPDFDMASEAAPFLEQAMLRRYTPSAVARHGWRALADTAEVIAGLPADLKRLLRAARHGNIVLKVELDRLKHFGEQVDHSANRLTVGIVTAALIVGSSIALTVDGGPSLLGLPLFGLLGFLGAGIGGVWLLYVIWRSGGGR